MRRLDPPADDPLRAAFKAVDAIYRRRARARLVDQGHLATEDPRPQGNDSKYGSDRGRRAGADNETSGAIDKLTDKLWDVMEAATGWGQRLVKREGRWQFVRTAGSTPPEAKISTGTGNGAGGPASPALGGRMLRRARGITSPLPKASQTDGEIPDDPLRGRLAQWDRDRIVNGGTVAPITVPVGGDGAAVVATPVLADRRPGAGATAWKLTTIGIPGGAVIRDGTTIAAADTTLLPGAAQLPGRGLRPEAEQAKAAVEAARRSFAARRPGLGRQFTLAVTLDGETERKRERLLSGLRAMEPGEFAAAEKQTKTLRSRLAESQSSIDQVEAGNAAAALALFARIRRERQQSVDQDQRRRRQSDGLGL